MRPSVVVADPIHDAGLASLRDGFDVAYLPEVGSPRERDRALAGAHALVVRTFPVDAALLDAAAGVALVVKHGAGVDNIDVAAATERRVLVANTPGGANATSVAEGAVTLMLAVARQVPAMDACVREGRFAERWTASLRTLFGRRLGLVGFGRIARVTAQICSAGLGMHVTAYDPYVDDEELRFAGVERGGTLEQLMAGADVISVHVALDADTRGLVGESALRAVRPGAILVNTSRGGTVDEAALVAALRDGRLAGAGIDVFEREPPPPSSPLLALDNVVLSPHVAGVTDESVREMAVNAAAVVAQAFAGDRPATLLNGGVWDERRI